MINIKIIKMKYQLNDCLFKCQIYRRLEDSLLFKEKQKV